MNDAPHAATDPRTDARVALVKLPAAEYATDDDAAAHTIGHALARACDALQLSDAARGPLARLIPPGARVLVKPNWVTHENQGPWGLAPLVTHQSFVRAAVQAALAAGAAEVSVGDAPIQGCRFDALLRATRLDTWAADLAAREPRFRGIRDFRRTISTFTNGVRVAAENVQAEEQFVVFDLGAQSLLEPVTGERNPFRVTCYDPRLMAATHARGRHRYLVAREVLDADVVINLPKLKTHKKAGITCALKNLIGINGNKEYLPHHRLGGAARGGDCYPGDSRVKRAFEYVLDQENQARTRARVRLWHGVAAQLNRVLHFQGDRLGLEGSWSGNDTVWRTGLDLNRILLYGRTDGTLAAAPQRQVVHLVDAVVAGQGDGPLAPQPLPLGLLLLAHNAAAMDWVGALLLGYAPQRVPLVREAFAQFDWPLASFASDEVTICGDLGAGRAEELLRARRDAPQVIYPAGWRDAATCADEGADCAEAESRSLTEEMM